MTQFTKTEFLLFLGCFGLFNCHRPMREQHQFFWIFVTKEKTVISGGKQREKSTDRFSHQFFQHPPTTPGSCVMESIYGPRTDGPSTALTSLTSRNSHGTSRNSRNSLLHGESHQAATSAAFRPTKSNSTHVSTGFFLPGPRRRQNE